MTKKHENFIKMDKDGNMFDSYHEVKAELEEIIGERTKMFNQNRIK